MLLPLLASLAPVQDLVAITHVTVLPMDQQRRLVDHTVLVEDGRIVRVGPSAEVAAPRGATRIDGTGQFLLPGLVDMHVHTWVESDLDSFLVNGVTTVRNMFGSPLQLALRERIASGERLGPSIVTAGPIVDGSPPIWPGSRVVTTPEDARAAVREQAQAGYDLIKVYQRLTRGCYDAIVDEAREVGLPVAGHVPTAVGVERALAAGQRTIEHLTGYQFLLQSEGAASGAATDFAASMAAWKTIDPARCAQVAAATREAGVWNCPTLVVLRKQLTDEQIEAEDRREYMRYVSAQQRARWGGLLRLPPEQRLAVQEGDAGRKALVKALHDAGGGIVLGTDTGNPFVAAGFSLHEELANLVDAGLSPYQALRAATGNAAECLESRGELGVVAPGARADLVLVAQDPFEDVGRVARPRGVMVRGRWLPREELDRMLAALER